jgi:hypothetical protein
LAQNELNLEGFDYSQTPQRREDAHGGGVWIVSDGVDSIIKVIVDKCSHMGAHLTPTRSGFICPSHSWSYSSLGENDAENAPGLDALNFSIEGNLLKFQTPDDVLLLSHASFLLESGTIKLLFDPWLTGEAYWGSWGLFPSNELDQEKLEGITHVIITHPHPDHFHPESLTLLSRDVEVLIPNFPSKIMPKILRRMGFNRIIEVEWEKEISVSPEVKFAFLRPNTVWEDSAVLVQVKNWVWLNQVDAGAPLRGELVPKNIDLLTSSFDAGASGYPLTWDMPTQRKEAILKNGKQQIMKSLIQRSQETETKNFAPFAGWWRHALPEHQAWAAMLNHTTMEDLDDAFKDSKTNLIPTIPSSRIVLKEMTHSFSRKVFSKLNKPPEISARKSVLGKEASLLEIREELRIKLQHLSEMAIATGCEQVRFSVFLEGIPEGITQDFGQIERSHQIEIKVTISEETSRLLAFGDELVTWNHLDIGYFGSWSRSPDIYPVNFMRLLQLGYVPELSSKTRIDDLAVFNTSVSDILEHNPDMASRIFGRAGLPCASCDYSRSESLRDALRIHGIGPRQSSILVAEISALLDESNVP